MPASLNAVQTLHGLVATRAADRPDAPAVTCGTAGLTYRELDERAELLARRLHSRGVGPEDVVGVLTRRGPDLVVAILGVLKAGAAYLPLTVDLPQARLSGLVKDAGVRVVVGCDATASTVTATGAVAVPVEPAYASPTPRPPTATASTVDPDSAAYVIYTSGSTGVPKGVVVSHRAATAHIRAMVARLDLGQNDVVLQMAGHAFDVAVEQLFAGLAAGARVVLRDDRVWGPAELSASLVTHAVTVADLPTALFTEMTTARHAGPLRDAVASLRAVLVGGEALPTAALDRWRAIVGPQGPSVHNAYGPTEAVMTASVYRAGAAPMPEPGDARVTSGSTVPIGTAIGPRTLHVVDGDLATVDRGGHGELFIGGAGLARGYLGRADLTAERFVPDPWGTPGSRMYRTGDRVAVGRDTDDLVFLGRTDEQIKMRGYRIEPGEIEARLLDHPDIAHAVVLLAGGELAAYIVGVDALDRPDPAKLESWLSDRLPAWMVPRTWQVLQELPVTAGGKVDRFALADRPCGSDTSARGRRAAQPVDAAPPDEESTVAGRVRRICEQVLGLDHIGVHDSFVDLGGNSLLATRVQADLRAEFGVELALQDLLAGSTVAAIASLVAAADTGDSPAVAGLPPLVRRHGAALTGPLSVMQEQIWFFEQLSPANVAYNAPTTIRLRGPVDVRLLEAALSDVVRRHEILRTTFTTRDGEPVQTVHAPYPVRIATRDLRASPDPVGAAQRIVDEEIRVPFDVARLPLLRWTMLRLDDDEYELILVEHHIIHDGWSFSVLMDELLASYAARAGWGPALAEPRLQYLDFVHWQRDALGGPAMRAQLQHWTERLAGAPDHLDLPYDFPRGGGEHSAGAVHRAELPSDLCAAVRAFSRNHGVTLFTTMMAAYAALLHRVTGQDELSIGSAYGNRAVPGTERMMGMLVNPVTLRLDVSAGQTFARLLDAVRAAALEAQANQQLPFVRLVRELAPTRRLGHNPMFAAMLNFDDSPLKPLRAGPIEATYLERHNGTAKLDLSVLVVPRAERQIGAPAEERDQRITMIWEYRSDLFAPETISRLFDGFVAVLRGALADPSRRLGELPVAAPPAANAATVSRAVHDRSAPDMPVHEMFARMAAVRGTAEAVHHPGHGGIGYDELNRRANRLGNALRRRGIGAEDIVGVCLDRSIDWVVAVLGVLKAGAAYLPLDPDSPVERIAALLLDAGPRGVVTDRVLPGTEDLVLFRPDDPAVGAAAADDPGVTVDPDQLAYLIYTSGSTGRPKAVAVSHRALARKYGAWRAAYDLDLHPGTHLQLAALAFDVCTGDMVRALLSGGRLVLCPPDAALDPAALVRVIREHRVDTVELLPSVANLIAAHVQAGGARPESLRLAAIGGESWTATDYRRLREAFGPDTRILNVYGVTEVTIGDLLRELAPVADRTVDDRPLPVGEPLPTVDAYVVDAAGVRVPVGVVGEILLGGVGVARGYHGRPDLTAERFLPGPGGTRRYATGDRGRFRPDGGIEYLGRLDQQVKIRGFRVEPGEVEHALRCHPDVADAVVVPHGDHAEMRLIAFVAGDGATVADPVELRDFLRARLPAYLVPAGIRVVAEIPRTSSGKVDRRALPDPGMVEASSVVATRPPRPGAEQRIAKVWCEVLGLPSVGADDNFFDLGGHSLLAARMTARLLAALGVSLSVRDLLAAPTVAGVARHVGRISAGPEPAASGPSLTPRPRQAYTVSTAAFDEPGHHTDSGSAAAEAPRAVTDGRNVALLDEDSR